jgi:YD repeat-containing protein
MKKILIIAGLLSAVVFTSCKKDHADGGGNGGGNTTKLIKKLTKLENGVTTVYNFSYDNARRLTGFASTTGKESTTFSYDAAGNLVKVEDIEDEFKNSYTYTWVNSVPASGTFKSWKLVAGEPDDLIEDDKLTYTISGNQVTKIHLEMTQTDQDMDFSLSYTNGNLTKVTSSQAGFYTATFVFGTKKSPFPQVTKYVLDQAGFSLVFGSQNELVTSAYDFPGTNLDYTITQQYTYDSAGYPLTADDGETKLTYEYQ